MPKSQAVQQASNGSSGHKLNTPLTDAERRRIIAALRGFLENADTQDQALSLYLNAKVAVRYPTFDNQSLSTSTAAHSCPDQTWALEPGALEQCSTIGDAC